jgi:hypothetical protein
MSGHPNFDRGQAALDAARQDNFAAAFDAFADEVVVENSNNSAGMPTVQGGLLPFFLARPYRKVRIGRAAQKGETR